MPKKDKKNKKNKKNKKDKVIKISKKNLVEDVWWKNTLIGVLAHPININKKQSTTTI